MKAELIDVTATQKNLVIEIPSSVVDAEIERVTRDYSRAARLPGFRPGKVPAKVVRQRFRSQILQDVAHGLIPKAVDEALRERGVEPVDTPDVRDVLVEEGQPMRFTATFETVPPVDPGNYTSLSLRRRAVEVTDGEVTQALEQLRERAARYEPVDDRPIRRGDTVQVDLERRAAGADAAETHEGLAVEIGAPANPPGFDDELVGLAIGTQKSFTITYPPDYTIKEMAGSSVDYAVAVKGIKRRVVPAADDEFAKDLGDFDTLDALRLRVREDLRHQAEQDANRELRADLLRQLAGRVSSDVPSALVEREIDRRVEEFARRLIEQQIDPMQASINWEEFRERQRQPATDAVRGALVLDEVARREGLVATEQEVNDEVARYAERTGRSVAAVQARLEKEGGLARVHAGLRREKAIDFLLSRATIARA